jgi:hypothetical protein
LTSFTVVTDFASVRTFVAFFDFVSFVTVVSIAALIKTLTFSEERFVILVTFSTNFEVGVQTTFAKRIGTFQTCLTFFDISFRASVHTLNIIE